MLKRSCKEDNVKKVAILTIVSQNYGNRLQNYALQEIIKKKGFEVETIRRNKNSMIYNIKNIIHLFLKTNSSTKFWLFNKKITWSKHVIGECNLKTLNNHYDFFVVGSDQVWNPHYSFVGSELDFLTFTPSNKRIAYAASFGVDVVPDNKVELYKTWLSDFNKISVREYEGAKIIKHLCEKEVEVVLDPTLLLAADDWRKIYCPPIHTRDDYILVYSVDKMGIELKQQVEELQKSKTVINVKEIANGYNCPIGPAEFLFLIDHASLLLTDSFHGTVFAILFHTPFRIFKRPGIDMSSRMKSLLKMAGIEEQQFDDDIWGKVDNKIEELRNYSLKFLYNALELSDSKNMG